MVGIAGACTTARSATGSALPQRGSELPECRGPFTCDGEISICRQSSGPITARRFTFTDSGYSLRSDGRGSYTAGVEGVGVFAGVAVVLFWRQPPSDPASARFISVNLDSPLKGSRGKKLGIIKDAYAEVAAQWYAEPARIDSTGARIRLQHSVRELPVGTSVDAKQVNIGVHIDGRYHILQMGPQPTGHCFVEGTAIHGEGTTMARISRTAEHRVVVEAPPGSIARLFDTFHTNKHAVDRGLYHVSFRYVIEK